MSDKYPGLSPFTYCANNPIILKDPNGMEFDEESKEMAKSLWIKADRKAERLERRAERTSNEEKKADLKERASELRTTAGQIRSMEANPEYTFHLNAVEKEPVTTPSTDTKHININYIEGSNSSAFHEIRHGFQSMSDQMNWGKDVKGLWKDFGPNAINNEVSAHRAEYSWSGYLAVPKCNPIVPLLKDPNKNQMLEAKNIKDITPDFIKSIGRDWGAGRNGRLY